MSTATNKQVKQVMSNTPHYLDDYLIVKETNVSTKLGSEYAIYRIEIVVVGEVVRYLDLITTIFQCYRGVGGFYGDIRSSHKIAETICDSLSVLDYLEDGGTTVVGYLEEIN